MALIKCSECKKKISDKSEVCIYCGCPVDKLVNNEKSIESKPVLKSKKKGSPFKYVFIVLGILLLIIIIGVFSNEPDDKKSILSNPRDLYVPQIEVITDYINIRENNSVDSAIVGKVSSGDIFTIVSNDADSDYNWYEIVTNNSIHGYISGTSKYVKKLEVKNDKVLVSLFVRSSCPYCKNLLAFLDTLDEEILSKIYIKEYVIDDNYLGSILMDYYQKHFDISSDEIGTPLLVINDNYKLGYSDSMNNDYIDLFKKELNLVDSVSSSSKKVDQTSKKKVDAKSSTTAPSKPDPVSSASPVVVPHEAVSSESPKAKTLTISSISGNGVIYSHYDTLCKIEDFQATVEDSSTLFWRINYTYKGTMIYKNKFDSCYFTVKIYDANNTVIKSFSEYLFNLEIGENAFESDNTLMYKTNVTTDSIYIKLVQYD